MKDIFIADLAKFEEQSVTAFFAATTKSLRDKKDGGKYLALVLTDRTGSMEARMWDNAAEASPEFEQGDVVKLKGAGLPLPGATADQGRAHPRRARRRV